MSTAVRLYQKHSQSELMEMRKAIEKDPENLAPPGELFRFKKEARRKLDKIDQAITWHLADKRAAAGDPVPTCGYSGRQSNRR